MTRDGDQREENTRAPVPPKFRLKSRPTCGIEQRSARHPHKVEVVGSNPAPATNTLERGFMPV